MTWNAIAHHSGTGWPVCATICENSASVSGAKALIAVPMAILVISAGSGQWRPYQRQKAMTPIIRKVLTTASMENIQLVGMVPPNIARS